MSIDNSSNSQFHFLPPFLAGLIFTLAPFHMAHLLGHMQVMSLEWVPFYVLYLLRGPRAQAGRPWLRSALLAGLFLILNGLCDWYFVLYLFLFTCFALVWYAAALMRRRAMPQHRRSVQISGRRGSAQGAHPSWATAAAARPAVVAGACLPSC